MTTHELARILLGAPTEEARVWVPDRDGWAFHPVEAAFVPDEDEAEYMGGVGEGVIPGRLIIEIGEEEES